MLIEWGHLVGILAQMPLVVDEDQTGARIAVQLL
jgi:hypothetical protein